MEEAVENGDFGLLERNREGDELGDVRQESGGARVVDGDGARGGSASTNEGARSLPPLRFLLRKLKLFNARAQKETQVLAREAEREGREGDSGAGESSAGGEEEGRGGNLGQIATHF